MTKQESLRDSLHLARGYDSTIKSPPSWLLCQTKRFHCGPPWRTAWYRKKLPCCCFREDAVAAGAGAKELVGDQCRVWLSGATPVAEQHLAENPQSENQPHVTNLPLLLDRMPCSASRGQKKRRFQVKAM